MFIVNSEPTEITYSLLGCMLITESDDTANLGYAMSFTVNILDSIDATFQLRLLVMSSLVCSISDFKLLVSMSATLADYKGIANYLYLIKLRGIWICYLINYKGIANYLYII